MRHGQTQNEREARGAHGVQSVSDPLPIQQEWSQVPEMSCVGLQRSMWQGCCGHCCRVSGVASDESQSQSCSQGLSSRAAEGAPRLMQAMEQAKDVQMADVQCNQQPPIERVAYRAALQVVGTTPLAMSIGPIQVETAQPMQKDMATPRACEGEQQGSAEAPGPTAEVSWSEEQLLELATSLPAMRTIRPSHGGRGKGRAPFSRSCCNTTRIAITNGPSGVILSPSRLRLLHPGGPGWVPRCLCGLMRAAVMRMTKD